MSEHTPEPWEIEMIRSKDDGHEGWISAFNFHYANGALCDWRGLAMTFGDDSAEGKRECTANASRIVACVNACAGMDDPAKEIAALRAQVEEYRYALEQIARVSDADGDDGVHREIAHDALAATGKE